MTATPSRTGACLLALLPALGACTTYAPRTPADRAAQWRAAEQASARGDWKLAAALWSEIRRGSPDPAVEPYLETARALQHIGEHDDALAILDAGIAAFPEQGELLFAHGALLDEMGFERAAEASLRSATRLLPDEPDVWLALGSVQLQLDNPLLACEAFDQATRLGFSDPAQLVKCARAERRAGQTERAWIKYARALEENSPREPEWLLEAASMMADPTLAEVPKDRLALARRWIDELTELDPQHAEAQFVRGLLAERASDFEGAIRSYRRAIELDNHHLGATNNLALVYLRLEDHAQAIEMIERALLLEKDPSRRAALLELQRVTQAKLG